MGLSIHFNGEKIFLNGAEIRPYIHRAFSPCDHRKVTYASTAYLLVLKSHRQSQPCAQRCSLIPVLPKYVQRTFLLKTEMPYFMV